MKTSLKSGERVTHKDSYASKIETLKRKKIRAHKYSAKKLVK